MRAITIDFGLFDQQYRQINLPRWHYNKGFLSLPGICGKIVKSPYH